MRNQKLLSICIPTYNRRRELEECLKSIVVQFRDKDTLNNIEIIISDNNSNDDTKDLIDIYRRKFKNIHYFKNKKNIEASANVLKVASYAKSKYIWFFADDDLQNKKSISKILGIIQRKNSDIILCNYIKFLSNPKKTIDRNCFKINENVFFKSKIEYFDYIAKNFFYVKNLPDLLRLKVSVISDSLTIFISSIIIKRIVYKKNLLVIDRKLLVNSCVPHSGLFLYTQQDFNFYLIAEPLIYNRLGNISWTKKTDYKTGDYWHTIIKNCQVPHFSRPLSETFCLN